MYDNRLTKKNEIVKSLETRIEQGVQYYEDLEKQFYKGVKTYVDRN